MTYGFGTHSYLNSTEHRQMKKEMRSVTERYERGELKFDCTLELLCECRSFRYPHRLSMHESLYADWDWRVKFR